MYSTDRVVTEVHITLWDRLNPGFGYQIKVFENDTQVLFTGDDPVTGKELATFEDALRVAGYYTRPT